jgi:hypothetical protein
LHPFNHEKMGCCQSLWIHFSLEDPFTNQTGL